MNYRLSILHFRSIKHPIRPRVKKERQRTSVGLEKLMTLRLEPGSRLVAATHNSGKAAELAQLLDGRFVMATASEIGLPEPDETESTFVGNAVLKARSAADTSGLVAIADDSGLLRRVPGCRGQPGVHSARWAGPSRDFAHAMDLVERAVSSRDRAR